MSNPFTKPRKTIIDPEFGQGLEALKEAKGTNQLVHSKGVCLDFGSYKYIALSGLVSIDDNMRPLGVGDIREQTKNTLDQISAALAEHGGTIDDIVRVRVYVVGLTPDKLRAIHEERAKYFNKEHYPASTLVEVAALILPELEIEIDCDAYIISGPVG